MHTRSHSTSNENYDADYTYSPDPATTTRTKIRKRQRKDTAAMKKQPEHVFIDYKYEDLNGSGILALDGEPTNAKFYTDKPVLWKNSLLEYHMNLYQQDIHSQMPSFRPSEHGDQLVVKGNYTDEREFLVTVFVYKTGVVLIQGKDFITWVDNDLPIIRALVEDDKHAVNRSLNESRAKSTPQRVRPAAPVNSPTPRLRELMVSTPTYTNKSSTPQDLEHSTEDSDSLVQARDAELQDLKEFCDNVQQMSTIEFNNDQNSRNDDATTETLFDCIGCHASQLIMSQLNEELAKLEEKIQNNEASRILKMKLVESEATNKALLERNILLESRVDRLSIQTTSLDPSSTSEDMPTRDITANRSSVNASNAGPAILKAGQLVKSTEDIITKTQTPQKPQKVRLSGVGDSNLRECGARLNSDHVNSIAWVYPGANFRDLASTIQDKDTEDTDIIAVHLGTNDALNTPIEGHALLGIKRVMDNIKHHVKTPLLICAVPPTTNRSANKTRSMINEYLDFECSRNPHQMRFVNNHLTLKDIEQDGIHLTPYGKDKLCRAIQKAALDFHRNGKQIIM